MKTMLKPSESRPLHYARFFLFARLASGVKAVVLASCVSGLIGPARADAAVETVVPSLLGRVSIDHSAQVATGFEMVKSVWPNAKMISEKSLNGWYEGRCYFRDRPNQPVAAMLIVSPQDSNLHGDLKGLMSRKSIVQVMDRHLPAMAFQNPSPELLKRVETLAKREQKLSSFAYESHGADFGLVADFFENEEREAFRLTLRRDKGRIFSTTTCTNTNGWGMCYDSSRAGRLLFVANRGESAQYCHYFRRIKK